MDNETLKDVVDKASKTLLGLGFLGLLAYVVHSVEGGHELLKDPYVMALLATMIVGGGILKMATGGKG